MEHEEQKDPVAKSTSVHSTTSAVDFSKGTLIVVKEEKTYDAGVFESHFAADSYSLGFIFAR